MHRTHLPLTVWFWAIWLVATDKRGISAVQLANTLGISYDSAWHLLDRIRAAMGKRDAQYLLNGIVEMDDGYVGGPCHGGKRGRGTEKAQVVAALSKTEQGIPLFLRLKVVPNIQNQTLQEIIAEHFEKKTVVECDGYKSYLNLKDVEVRAKKYATGDLHWLHIALSNLKNLIRGTYHGRCTELQPYLDEFCFRFNRRMCAGQLFSRLTRAVATSGSLLSKVDKHILSYCSSISMCYKTSLHDV